MKQYLLMVITFGMMFPIQSIAYERFPFKHTYCENNTTDHQRTFPYFLGDIDTGERCGYSYFSRRRAAIR